MGAIHIPEKEKYSMQRLTGSKRKCDDEESDAGDQEDRVLRSLIHSHNDNMKAIKDDFSNDMEAWKKTVQQEQKKRIAVNSSSKERIKNGAS